ncbi:MAG TPA: universal stress protein [Streptosporangiaceae bacterium]|jgi:nucleotide-binding universal stress UspA family protein
MSAHDGAGLLAVVGVDGSAASVAALSWAARYSEATGATVRAVMAWHYPAAVGPGPPGRAPHDISDEVSTHMQDQLDKAVALVYHEPSERLQAKVAYGHPVDALIEESQDADLLVVGSRGHGAWTGMLTGSVSLHCVTTASCPVVVVHDADRPR